MSDDPTYLEQAIRHLKAGDAQLGHAHALQHAGKTSDVDVHSNLANAHINMARALLSLHVEESYQKDHN